MNFKHKPDTGSLFKNDERKSDNHPHARGSALIGGVEYWVAAWTNTKDSGEKYQSLKFSRKDENRAERPKTPEKAPEPDFDDDIPF